MKNRQFDIHEDQISMTNNDITTLTVRICGSIETPPEINRDDFRQGVIETVLQVMKTKDIGIEYVGYQPDCRGIHHLESFTTEYSDCVYVSFNVDTSTLQYENENWINQEEIVDSFIDIFQHKTHRHLEIDSTVIKDGSRQRIIEMSSDWKFYLKHA